MECPFCHLYKTKEWMENVEKTFLELKNAYGTPDFKKKKEAHKIASGSGICQHPPLEEMQKVFQIQPFDRETTPYPLHLAEIEDRIAELHEEQTTLFLEEYSLDEAKKRASHALYRQQEREWTQLCRDEDRLRDLTRKERFEMHDFLHKKYADQRKKVSLDELFKEEDAILAEKYVLLRFSKKVSEAIQDDLDNGMEEQLLRLCNGKSYDILRGNFEEE